MKSTIKHYLSITKKEWNGMVVLVILILLICAIPYIYQMFHEDKTINFKDFNADIALLNKAKAQQSAFENKIESKRSVPDRKVVSLNYTHSYSAKLKPGEVIEINSADSVKLTMMRGIGPSFARRIIRYRDRLGGFVRKTQLKEVFGLDSVKYGQIRDQIHIDPSNIKRINVNTVTFEELHRFPYLTYKQMNAVIQYRNQHGEYQSINDMKNIAIIDESVLHKMGPYLIFK